MARMHPCPCGRPTNRRFCPRCERERRLCRNRQHHDEARAAVRVVEREAPTSLRGPRVLRRDQTEVA